MHVHSCCNLLCNFGSSGQFSGFFQSEEALAGRGELVHIFGCKSRYLSLRVMKNRSQCSLYL